MIPPEALFDAVMAGAIAAAVTFGIMCPFVFVPFFSRRR
jgi:hypothetical protein